MRLKLLAAFALLLFLCIGGLAWGLHAEMENRLTAQYTHRIANQVRVIQAELEEESRKINDRMAAFKREVADDNRLRLAIVDQIPEYRPYLLDYSERAMSLMGFSMLQVQDASGAVLSSGHFRNDYGHVEAWLPRTLARTAGNYALFRGRRPDGPFLAFGRVDSVRMGSDMLYLVGGFSAQQRFLRDLSPDDEIAVSLIFPGGVHSTDTAMEGLLVGPDSSRAVWDEVQRGAAFIDTTRFLARDIEIPFAMPGRSEAGELLSARLLVTHSLAPIQELRDRMQLWTLGALALTAVAGLALAAFLSFQLSRPLHRLAAQTTAIDLDHLDLEFPVHRGDEVGTVARFLTSMMLSLRSSVVRLKDAERRATLGDVARQVNHDVKNGLIPIRNVLRHLSQVSREEPESLPRIYKERSSTLHSSMSYLERLAENYAKLTPRIQVRECDVNPIVSQVTRARSGDVDLETELSPDLPKILADLISLRRILENLIQNAGQSVPGDGGRIFVKTQSVALEDGPGVRITVGDNGPGLSQEELERVFDDFYTTREEGIGLGLSIVRRLAADLNGSVWAESPSGGGARFHVDLPAVDAERPRPGKGE